MATILITGGTGLVGTALTQLLIKEGHEAIVLTRTARPAQQPRLRYAAWDPEAGTIDADALAAADVVVHLAGANVADGRWTEKRKQEIVNSRVRSGELLARALRTQPNRVHTVVSASAIGWYGADPVVPNPKPFVEADPAAADTFLGRTCAQWEGAIRPVEELGKRLVIARIGIVLGRDGGAYAEFRKPMRFGLATVMGNGKQVVSWIHIEDLARFFATAALDRSYTGVYNLAAPHPVANKELVQAIARARGGFHLTVPAPSLALKIALGEMSVEVLKSTTVSSKKLLEQGFVFEYPEILTAANDLEREK